MLYYLGQNGQTLGPYSLDQMKELSGSGKITPADFAWREGMANWVPVSEVLSVAPPAPAVTRPAIPAATAPASANAAPQPAARVQPAIQQQVASAVQKSRVAYILFALFLGGLGIHNFYAGYVGRGVAQLLISLLSIGLLAWVSGIWALVECFVIKQDAKGVEFS